MNTADLRLLIDHNIGRGVALALCDAGYDAVFAGDVDPHLSDTAILAWAVSEGRLIITQDNDFGALVYRSGKPHSGVLLLRMPDATRQERTTTLLWLLDHYAAAISGHFSVFQNDQLRIRSSR
ncbi:MAG: DUF5615 family PIN-like protein [Chloroflexi bacterium]|nr:DUF5615 family PIN-like protein [Chloroflexota bacterium]